MKDKRIPCSCEACKNWRAGGVQIAYPNKECPCEGCISLAICRHKPYIYLFKQCPDLEEYIPVPTHPYQRNADRIVILEKILNPTDWTFIVDHQYTHDCPLVLRKEYKEGQEPTAVLRHFR